MTAIAGLIDSGKVWIGGDRMLSGNGIRQTMKAPKVFTVGKRFLIGSTGTLRAMDILRFHLHPPLKPDDQDEYEYMIRHFVPAMMQAFKDNESHGTYNGEIEASCTAYALVGFNGRIFKVGRDYSVVEETHPFGAVGSGSEICVGSLATTEGMDMTPEKRISIALEAAAEHAAGVGGPFDILTI